MDASRRKRLQTVASGHKWSQMIVNGRKRRKRMVRGSENKRWNDGGKSCSLIRPSCPVWPCKEVRLTDVRTGGDASNMNIHYDVTGLLTVVWRSHSGQIVRAAWICQGGGGGEGSELVAHIRDIQESAGSRQLDRWRWIRHDIMYVKIYV